MERPYSQDLCERGMAAVDEGGDVNEIAPLFNVHVCYTYKVLSHRRMMGETAVRGNCTVFRRFLRHMTSSCAPMPQLYPM